MMEQYTKLKQQTKELEAVAASLKNLQRKVVRIHLANSTHIKDAFESVVRSLELRCQAAEKEMEVERNLSSQTLRSVDGDCETLLRYVRAKRQQLKQLQQLGEHSPVLGIKRFNDVAATVEALEEKTDILTDMRERLGVPHWRLSVLEISSLLEDRQEALQRQSDRINIFCEDMSSESESFLSFRLPLDAYPAQHRDVETQQQRLRQQQLQQQQQQQQQQQEEQLRRQIHSNRPAVYPAGTNPYSKLFLQRPPDKYQAFVRK
ncbi:hypothetical protein EPH_0038600 [Eimeria praecox]|uniref:Uncharacterized protein n=1 Tax=Eimeria praecox TaxID=51316 RepID=U6G6J6_9EIME|nr:hypothetical protein EPH_0038600 [Eimeria praecox]